MGIIIARSIAPTINSGGRAGHLFIDERAAGGTVREADIWSCSHCQAIIFVRAWREEGAFCHKCNSPICASCGTIDGCTPFIKRVEMAVEERYRREQLAKTLGI